MTCFLALLNNTLLQNMPFGAHFFYLFVFKGKIVTKQGKAAAAPPSKAALISAWQLLPPQVLAFLVVSNTAIRLCEVSSLPARYFFSFFSCPGSCLRAGRIRIPPIKVDGACKRDTKGDHSMRKNTQPTHERGLRGQLSRFGWARRRLGTGSGPGTPASSRPRPP